MILENEKQNLINSFPKETLEEICKIVDSYEKMVVDEPINITISEVNSIGN